MPRTEIRRDMEQFQQDVIARVRVLQLRYRIAFAGLAVLIFLVFGTVGLLEPTWTFRILAFGVVGVTLGSAALLMRRAIAKAKVVESGHLTLSEEGVRFEPAFHDIESSAGFIPWTEVGGVSSSARWDSRRFGVRRLVVICRGRATRPWTYPGPRGFSDSFVVSWLSHGNATVAVSRIRALAGLAEG